MGFVSALVGPGLSDTGFVGEHDSLDSVADAELGEESADVGLDGGLADV